MRTAARVRKRRFGGAMPFRKDETLAVRFVLVFASAGVRKRRFCGAAAIQKDKTLAVRLIFVSRCLATDSGVDCAVL